MIVAKTEMKKRPTNCWNCDLIHDRAQNGSTVCSMLHERLYPMGLERVLDNCPLMEVEEDGKV